MDKLTKIDAAIKETKLSLNKTNEDIMILMERKSTLINQLNTLEIIKENKNNKYK